MWNLEIRKAGVISIACVHSPLNSTVGHFGLLQQNTTDWLVYVSQFERLETQDQGAIMVR